MFGGPRPVRNPQGARSKIAVGLVLQAIGAGVFFLVWAETDATFGGGGILFYLGAAGAALVAFGGYGALAPVLAGDLERARGPTLLLAVLTAVTGGLFASLFYALAHHDLEPLRVPVPSAAGGTAGTPLRSATTLCPACQAANGRAATFCRGCGFLLA